MKTIPKTGQTFYVTIARDDLKPTDTPFYPFASVKECEHHAQEWTDSTSEEYVVIECRIVKRVRA